MPYSGYEWSCDVCSAVIPKLDEQMRPTTGVWHCATCQYDVCVKCQREVVLGFDETVPAWSTHAATVSAHQESVVGTLQGVEQDLPPTWSAKVWVGNVVCCLTSRIVLANCSTRVSVLGA